MDVTVLDPVYSKIDNKNDRRLLRPCLIYEDSYWKHGGYVTGKDGSVKYLKKKKTLVTRDASFIDLRNGLFPTGFLPRIERYCKLNDIDLSISRNFCDSDLIGEPVEPHLKGIEFFPFQHRLINTAINKRRGLIQAPTGSGKTIIQLGIISAWSKATVLFLCHNLSIIHQTYKEVIKYGFKNVIRLGGGSGDWNREGKIVLSTIQTFSKMDPDLYADYFDIIIIDEAHRFSESYLKVMKSSLSTVRLGFTATMPSDKKRLLELEGFMGRLIGKYKVEDAVEDEILAVPKVKLVPVPYVDPDSFTYKEIYERCIVHNLSRNSLIVEQVQENIKEDRTSLVVVTEIAHGREIRDVAKDKGVEIIFIQGKTSDDIRETIKELLENRTIKAVITTNIWREGVNIRSLDSIILAFGGKSNIATLQTMGRSLRRTSTKKEALLIDFLDTQKYLSQHAIERITTYVKQGWL